MGVLGQQMAHLSDPSAGIRYHDCAAEYNGHIYQDRTDPLSFWAVAHDFIREEGYGDMLFFTDGDRRTEECNKDEGHGKELFQRRKRDTEKVTQDNCNTHAHGKERYQYNEDCGNHLVQELNCFVHKLHLKFSKKPDISQAFLTVIQIMLFLLALSQGLDQIQFFLDDSGLFHYSFS